MDELYKNEKKRLESFEDWPTTSPMDKTELAKAGWYYVGIGDKVKCPWCKGGVFNWENDDTPFGEHARHYPSCLFVKDKLLKDEWRKLTCVKAIMELGYSESSVEKAVFCLKEKGVHSFNTDNIMDELLGSTERESTLLCKVCFDGNIGELFLPCRHLLCCILCSKKLNRCPLCRELIVGTIKVFLIL